MKEYACGDVVPGCGARFRAADEDEMLALCTVHAQHAHGLTEPAMPDDLIARIRAVIVTV
jgi:predicted small metal-binding protein